MTELAAKIMMLENKISKINNLDYLVSCEVLKESINLKVQLNLVYSNYLKSNSLKSIVDELSETSPKLEQFQEGG
jgi:hypothetical protein